MRVAVRRSWTLPLLLSAACLVLVSGGAVAAVETDSVASFAQGVWWSLSLMTTVGFIGDPPATALGAVLSAVLMVAGFFLLALVGAALASLFVREDEQPVQDEEQADLQLVLRELRELRAELAELRAQRNPPIDLRSHAGAGSPTRRR